MSTGGAQNDAPLLFRPNCVFRVKSDLGDGRAIVAPFARFPPTMHRPNHASNASSRWAVLIMAAAIQMPPVGPA